MHDPLTSILINQLFLYVKHKNTSWKCDMINYIEYGFNCYFKLKQQYRTFIFNIDHFSANKWLIDWQGSPKK